MDIVQGLLSPNLILGAPVVRALFFFSLNFSRQGLKQNPHAIKRTKYHSSFIFQQTKMIISAGKRNPPSTVSENRTGIAGWLLNIHGLEIILLNQSSELFMKNRFS